MDYIYVFAYCVSTMWYLHRWKLAHRGRWRIWRRRRSRPILAFRPRPIAARFIEVLNKTWMSACSDINQSIPVQQLTHLLACSITIDARVWVICTLAALHSTSTTNPWPLFTLLSVWIHRSHKWNNTNSISVHRLSPYNAHYLNNNFLLSFRSLLMGVCSMRFVIITAYKCRIVL